MLHGFAGWHILIALGVFLTFAVIVAAVIVIIIVVSRRDGPVTAPSGSSGRGTQPHAPQPVSARLAELERLRANGHVSETEYSAKRAEILEDL